MTPTAPSPFAVRGIVEGFYGNPWTHEQRLELLGFMASRGLNTFVYTPKDDPLVRRAWRAPYEGRELRRLNELVNRALSTGVDFVFCVSPGLSMRYSDESDLDALTSKFASVEALGVQAFGLLFDDIPRDLQHEEDRAAFDTLADAHVSVANHVADRLGQRTRLIVCPTVYSGYGTEEYVAILGAGLEPGIDIFWTGRAACSPALDVGDAAVFERAARRPATYWDNYPVNDEAMGFELHIGPYRGRDPHLFRHAFGVVANGMELYEASKIPFATIADYLAAPETYDPERSWRRAIRDVVGDADLDAFLLFADNVRSSCLSPDDAPVVTARARVVRVPAGPGRGAGRGGGSRDARGPAHRRRRPPAARAGRERRADRRVPPLDRGVRDRGAGDAPDRRARRERPARARRADGPASVPRPASERPGASVRQRARQDAGRPHGHPRPAGIADAGRAGARGLTA